VEHNWHEQEQLFVY